MHTKSHALNPQRLKGTYSRAPSQPPSYQLRHCLWGARAQELRGVPAPRLSGAFVYLSFAYYGFREKLLACSGLARTWLSIGPWVTGPGKTSSPTGSPMEYPGN